MEAPRKQRRHHLIFYLQVFDLDSGQQLGYLGDVTTEGLMVMSRRPIAPGERLSLEIRTVQDLTDEHTLRCDVQSRWCHDNTKQDFYAVGCRLLRPEQDTQQAIRRLIREIGFQEAWGPTMQ